MSDFQHNPDGREIETPFLDPELEQKRSPKLTPFPDPETPFLDGFNVAVLQNPPVTAREDEAYKADEGAYSDSLYDAELSATIVPTPGRFYKIQYGKGGLLKTAEKAYKTSSNAERLKRAQQINNHPLNRKFWKTPGNAYERKHFSNGIINFNPVFTCGEEQSLASKGEKKCFAKIWIPVKEIFIHPQLGRGLDLPKGYLVARLKPNSNVSSAELELLEHEALAETAKSKGALKKVGKDKIKEAPYRFICSIIVTAQRPGLNSVEFCLGPATGTLIGFRHVLTAAHILRLEEKGKILKVNDVLVTPMHYSTGGLPKPKVEANDPSTKFWQDLGIGGDVDPKKKALPMSKRPLGSFRASSYEIPPQYSSTGSSVFDIALIKLDASVGNLPWGNGRFGYWGSSRWGGRTILTSVLPSSLLSFKLSQQIFTTLKNLQKNRVNVRIIAQLRGFEDRAFLTEAALLKIIKDAVIAIIDEEKVKKPDKLKKFFESLILKSVKKIARTVCTSGYPTTRVQDRGINQWEGSGPVDDAIPEYAKSIEQGWLRLGYQVDTEDGHSGNPVWLTFNSGGKTTRKLVAVHSDGGHSIEASSGVLITPEVLDWIQKSW